ncbi:MAG: conjugal transfer protein TraG N-terminal domain-containing protein [Nitrososphaeria archaeon]
MIRRLFPLLSLGILFSLFNKAFAYTWEHTTYGGYVAAVEAWKRVALIFSDENFKGLILVAIVAGALVLFYSFLARIAFGARVDPIRNWFLPVLFGMIVAVALVMPKDKVIIYDEVLERGPYEVNGIPRVLGFVVHVMNKIESGLIDVIDTSVIDPISQYKRTGGGSHYKVLASVSSFSPSDSIIAKKRYFANTLAQYFKDCVTFEIARTNGATINYQMLLTGEKAIEEIINAAKNPSVYTTIWNSDGSVSEGVSCQDAGSYILSTAQNEFNIGNPGGIAYLTAEAACEAAGYERSTRSMDECMSVADSLIKTIASNTQVSGNPDLSRFIYYLFVGHVLETSLLDQNPEKAFIIAASSKTMSNFWAMSIHAGEWILAMKEALCAFCIAVSPLVFLLATTPLVGRALSLLAGFFIWLLCWGVIDAVIYTFGKELMLSHVPALGSFNRADLGTALAMTIPSFSTKVVGILSMLRWAGLGLASIFSIMLVRFGGTALALVGQHISSAPVGTAVVYSSFFRNLNEPLSEISSFGGFTQAVAESGSLRELYTGQRQGIAYSTLQSSKTGLFRGTLATQGLPLGEQARIDAEAGVTQQLVGGRSFLFAIDRVGGRNVPTIRRVAEAKATVETHPQMSGSLSMEDILSKLYDKTKNDGFIAYLTASGKIGLVNPNVASITTPVGAGTLFDIPSDKWTVFNAPGPLLTSLGMSYKEEEAESLLKRRGIFDTQRFSESFGILLTKSEEARKEFANRLLKGIEQSNIKGKTVDWNEFIDSLQRTQVGGGVEAKFSGGAAGKVSKVLLGFEAGVKSYLDYSQAKELGKKFGLSEEESERFANVFRKTAEETLASIVSNRKTFEKHKRVLEEAGINISEEDVGKLEKEGEQFVNVAHNILPYLFTKKINEFHQQTGDVSETIQRFDRFLKELVDNPKKALEFVKENQKELSEITNMPVNLPGESDISQKIEERIRDFNQKIQENQEKVTKEKTDIQKEGDMLPKVTRRPQPPGKTPSAGNFEERYDAAKEKFEKAGWKTVFPIIGEGPEDFVKSARKVPSSSPPPSPTPSTTYQMPQNPKNLLDFWKKSLNK